MSETVPPKPKRQPPKYITAAANKAKAAGYQTSDIRQQWRKPECIAYTKYGIWPEHLPPPVMAAHPITATPSNAENVAQNTATLHSCDCEPLEDPAPPAINRDSIRVRHVRFYFDDFFGDRRVQTLEPQRQQQWLYLLACMMHSGGTIADNPVIVGHKLAISQAAAKALVKRLVDIGLLVRGSGDMLGALASPRLSREYESAVLACQMYADRASKGGKGKAAKSKGGK